MMVFPSGHVLSWLGSRAPRDQADHTIRALARDVTSGDRPVLGRTAGFRDTVQRAARTAGMPVRLRHIVVDAHDLPGLARFWTQALGWKVLSERENEIVFGTDQNAPVGMCFMPVTDSKTVKNRVHLDLTSSAADRDQEIDRLRALGRARPASARRALSPGLSWPIRRETSSASCGRRKRSSDEARHREPQTDPVRGKRVRLTASAVSGVAGYSYGRAGSDTGRHGRHGPGAGAVPVPNMMSSWRISTSTYWG